MFETQEEATLVFINGDISLASDSFLNIFKKQIKESRLDETLIDEVLP